jgi:glutathione S-transferase
MLARNGERAMPITLYYHPLSSFCHKVLIALYEHNMAFERRIVDVGNEADRAALTALWPFAKFPLIWDAATQRAVPESSIIIEFLDQTLASTGADHAPLIPLHAATALTVRLWDRTMDHYVQRPMQAVVANEYSAVKTDSAENRRTLSTAYALLNAQLQGREWLASPSFSLADCAAAPALFYGATVQPIPEELTNLHAYISRVFARPSVQRVLAEAKPYFEMYPFASQIPARFR